LYKGIKDVIESGGRVFYCDTDSIAAGYNELKVNEKIGEIR
jgi:hypothetical protein